jgi:hypothetical protein
VAVSSENPVNLQTACRELGIGLTYGAALKKRLGLKGRFVFVSDMRKFLKQNPDFQIADVYSKMKVCSHCGKKRPSKDGLEIRRGANQSWFCSVGCAGEFLLELGKVNKG